MTFFSLITLHPLFSLILPNPYTNPQNGAIKKQCTPSTRRNPQKFNWYNPLGQAGTPQYEIPQRKWYNHTISTREVPNPAAKWPTKSSKLRKPFYEITFVHTTPSTIWTIENREFHKHLVRVPSPNDHRAAENYPQMKGPVESKKWKKKVGVWGKERKEGGKVFETWRVVIIISYSKIRNIKVHLGNYSDTCSSFLYIYKKVCRDPLLLNGKGNHLYFPWGGKSKSNYQFLFLHY